MKNQLLEKIFRRTSISRDVFLTLIGALLGVLTSHLYYMKSVSDMRADAEERRRIDDLIFRGIESVGSMSYVRDEAGKVVGVNIQLHAAAQVQATGSATLVKSP